MLDHMIGLIKKDNVTKFNGRADEYEEFFGLVYICKITIHNKITITIRLSDEFLHYLYITIDNWEKMNNSIICRGIFIIDIIIGTLLKGVNIGN